jgi:hypothetical protein
LQALTTFDEVRDVFRAVRSSNFVGERQPSSRPRKEDETKAQQETRDRYYMAIERLINDNDVFARLQSLQYAFPACFGEAARQSFPPSEKCATKSCWPLLFSSTSHRKTRLTMTAA